MLTSVINFISQYQLSTQAFSRICQIGVTLAGSMVSPTWGYFKAIINPWLNIEAFSQVSSAIPEVLSFYEKVALHKDLVQHTLLPQLGLCFVCSIAFLIGCRILGSYVAKYLMTTRFGQRMVAEA